MSKMILKKETRCLSMSSKNQRTWWMRLRKRLENRRKPFSRNLRSFLNWEQSKLTWLVIFLVLCQLRETYKLVSTSSLQRRQGNKNFYIVLNIRSSSWRERSLKLREIRPLKSKSTLRTRSQIISKSLTSKRSNLICSSTQTSNLLMKPETSPKSSIKPKHRGILLKLRSRSLNLRMKWLLKTLILFKKVKKRPWSNMPARSLKLRSLEIQSTLRLIVYTVSKIESINLKCPWKREKRKSMSIKISLHRSQKQLKKKDIR